MTNIISGIAEWEIVPGWPLGVFAWWTDWIVLGVFALLCGGIYFLYVWLFGRLKCTAEEKAAVKELTGALRRKKGKECKTALAVYPPHVRRVVGWNIKLRMIFTPIVTVLLVLALIAAPVFTTVGPLLWSTLFPPDNLNSDSEAARLAIGEAKENVVTLESEGAVLVKNENGALPLDAAAQPKINIFGAGAFGMLYGGGGSGVFVTNATVKGNELYATRLEKALADEGFEYNEELYNLVANYYESGKYKVTHTDYDIQCQLNTYPDNGKLDGQIVIPTTCLPQDNEPEAAAYTAAYAELGGKTLLASAKEFSDTALFCVSRAGSEDGDLRYSEVKLTDRERDVIGLLKDNFEKVIVLINSSNAMELGILDDENVDAVLWVGHPGLTGNEAVAGILAGRIDPSGKLADTWAYDVSTAPAFLMYGHDNAYTYANGASPFQVYYEGIYIGYRYYATRALTDSTFAYDDHVQWSFGHGLSYTTFEKHITEKTVDKEKGTVSVQVAVTNTGDTAGKEVVEVYFTPPYVHGGTEKSAVELAGFTKTGVIGPGDTFFARVEFAIRDMASWDSSYSNYIGAYVLDAGTYEVSLRDNVWDKTVSAAGETSFEVEFAEAIVYDEDEKTGTNLMNRFDGVEFGPNDAPVTYLSRADWTGTYPTKEKIDRVASQSTLSGSKIPTSFEDNRLPGNAPVTGAKNGLTIRDLAGKEYDDPLWPQLLDQLTLREMQDLVDNGGFQTVGIDSIGKPQTYDDDGPASVSIYGVGYVSEVVIASSWNVECAELLGMSLGKEGAAMGLTGWYAPGLNMHRTALGGRNFEYFSEDPLLSGLMGAGTARGAAEYGVYTYLKHFALNDQETNRRGIQVWTNEQALREVYLRPFELAVKQGKALGIMSSFNRIGAVWTGASRELLTDVLRDEWGFRGAVVTDYLDIGIMPVNLGLRAGNDLWLYRNTTYSAAHAYGQAPHDVAILLRNASHNILYAVANSNAVWTDEQFAAKGIERGK